MLLINVTRPHGYLLQKGKQTALASDKMLPVNEPVQIVCDGEVYGEATLSGPAAVSLSEFERLQPEHCIKPPERALYWPGVDVFYIHQLKEWQPYDEPKPLEIIEPDETEQALLDRAEELPKTIVLDEAAITLAECGATIRPLVAEAGRIEAMIKAGLGQINLATGRYVPLYQLALVRSPRLGIKKKDGEESSAAEQINDDKQGGETMPYKINEEMVGCDGIAVIKTDTDEIVDGGCHETMEEAMAHLAALKLNVEVEEEDDEDKTAGMGEGDKAKWTTAYINTLPDASFLYIAPGGERDDEGKTIPRTLRYFPYKDADGTVDMPHLRNAAARIPQSDLDDTIKTRLQKRAQALLEDENEGGEKAGARLKKTWRDKLKEMYENFKELVSWVEYEDQMPEPMAMDMFSKGVAVKEINGQPWFFAHSTNAFEDREGEIFSTKALEQYVKEAEQLNSRGFFNLWHIGTFDNPGLTDFARKEWQGVIGRVLVEAGPFLNDAKGRAALEFFKQYPTGHPDDAPEGWGCSPEYRYLPEERKSGVYSWIWITRTSVLPRAAAANVWTKGGITMALSDQQKAMMRKVLGDALAEQIIADAEAKTKELEKAGVGFKKAPEGTPKETPKETPAEPPAETAETPQAEPETKPATADEVAAAVIEQLGPALATMAGKIDELGGRVKGLETAKEAKTLTETPRWLLSQFERASQSKATAVAEGDELTNQKPQETPAAKDRSGAAHFFPAQ